jgi:hypothetical protein
MTTHTSTRSSSRTITLALALAAALAAALALLAPGTSSAQPTGNSGGLASLVGAWRMTSLEVGGPISYQRVPYSGQIVFTKSGTMSVQASNPDQDAPDTAYTVNGYEAFYGSVQVDRAAGTFDVTVENAVAPALVGQTLTRVYTVSRNTLVLTPADPSEGWRVTYERV